VSTDAEKKPATSEHSDAAGNDDDEETKAKPAKPAASG